MPAPSDGPAPARRPRRVALILAGLALIAVAAVAAVLISRSSSGSSAAQQELFGIAAGAPFDRADLQKMEATEVRAVRFLLSWSTIQANQGSPDWSEADGVVGGLASHGIQPVPFVYGSPQWVSPDPARPPIDSAVDRAAWGAFLSAAVTRYGPGGSYWKDEYPQQFGHDAAPLPITAWQIWNEPNLPHYFAPRSSASEYAKLLRLSHQAIAQQDPSAKIVLAGMPGYGKPDTAWRFLEALYRQPGFEDAFDAVALHPYARTVGQLRLETERLRSVMVEHGDADVPLWLTELGWGSGEPNRFGLNKGLEGQKRLLERSFALILDQRRSWRVERLFWFEWRDPPPGTPQSCSFCSSAGLLRSDGDPKPSWDAYRRFAHGEEG